MIPPHGARDQASSPCSPCAIERLGGGGRDARIPLRLAVTKGGLGLELDQALTLGIFEIERLTVSLVGLSFPVDLSGGVARFRHRRGALESTVAGGEARPGRHRR